MPNWKKVIISGSNISQLNNDAGYVATTGGGIVSSSAQIDHDQTTNFVAGEHFLQSAITTVGTITTGTWQGSAISTTYIQNTSGTNTGDEPDASTTVKGIVELATTAEVTTGTDTTRAVTPDALKDGFKGSTNIVTLGTIAAGDVSAVLPSGTISGSAQIDALGYFNAPSEITMGGDVSGTANNVNVGKIQGVAITSGEATQLATIGSVTITNAQWSYVGAQDQKTDSGAAVTFATVNTGQGATEVHLMNQNVRTSDDVTFNDVTVSGDLTVSGTVTNVNTTDLNVEDSWILLASGSGATGDAGIIVETTSLGVGTAFGYDFTAEKRWGIDLSGADSDSNSVTFDAYVSVVVDEGAGQSTSAGLEKNGNLRVTSGGDIYIYA